jgi:hypothetical protein
MELVRLLKQSRGDSPREINPDVLPHPHQIVEGALDLIEKAYKVAYGDRMDEALRYMDYAKFYLHAGGAMPISVFNTIRRRHEQAVHNSCH